jgi:hypothetical protein
MEKYATPGASAAGGLTSTFSGFNLNTSLGAAPTVPAGGQVYSRFQNERDDLKS